MVSTGIGLTGVAVDADGRVLDKNGRPVAGLHAAGAAAAFTASGAAYNSGFSLGRAITLGLLVAESLYRRSRSALAAAAPTARSSVLRTFPEGVRGSAATNRT